jgi:iron complex outermembrane receptor protein
LLDGALTLNGDVFYYNYTGYQISEIVDRTAINNNYNAHVEGAEVTADWEPLPGLKFNFAGGWEDTAAAGGDTGIDLMNRTAGMPGWMVVKPFPTAASNCIVPTYVVGALLEEQATSFIDNLASFGPWICRLAYTDHLDPATGFAYTPNPTGMTAQIDSLSLAQSSVTSIPVNYPGFDPSQPAINDNPYDRIHGYATANLTLIFTNQNGWQVMLYDKNVFNTTAITGDFLNSDDSGLTTNVFLTDPKLVGIRVTKNW